MKSYRDSATYKRRHGIPLEAGEVDDEPDAVALGDAGGAKRGRGRSAAAAETAPTVDRGGRRRAPVVEPAGKSARGGLGPSRPWHSAPDLAARGGRGAPRGMLGPGPALAPSLPPWVSRLPELAATRGGARRRRLVAGGLCVVLATAPRPSPSPLPQRLPSPPLMRSPTLAGLPTAGLAGLGTWPL